MNLSTIVTIAAAALVLAASGCASDDTASSPPTGGPSALPSTVTFTQTTAVTPWCRGEVKDGDTVAAAGPGLTFDSPIAITGFSLSSADGSTDYDVSGTKAFLYDREDQPESFTSTSATLAGIIDTEPFLPGSATPLINQSFDPAHGDLVPVFEFAAHWTTPDGSDVDEITDLQATLTWTNPDGSAGSFTYPTKISLYREADQC